MNKSLLIVIALLAVPVGYYFYNSSVNSKMVTKDEDVMMYSPTSSTDSAMMTGEDKKIDDGDAMMMEKTSKYVPYAEGVLEGQATTRRILYFYASWCPTCRPADAELTKRAAELPSGTTVIRVNYNDPETDAAEKDLAKKYGVTYQHTFVEIDQEGNKVASWNGGGFDQLIEKLK